MVLLPPANTTVRDYAIGEEAPDFSLPDRHGVMRALSSYRGKKRIICFFEHDLSSNVFAKDPMQQLYALQDAYPMLQQYGFEVIAVVAGSKQVIDELYDANKIPYVFLYDDNRLAAGLYDAVGYSTVDPLTVIIDENDLIIDTILGYNVFRHLAAIFLYALEQIKNKGALDEKITNEYAIVS